MIVHPGRTAVEELCPRFSRYSGGRTKSVAQFGQGGRVGCVGKSNCWITRFVYLSGILHNRFFNMTYLAWHAHLARDLTGETPVPLFHYDSSRCMTLSNEAP